MPTCIIGRGGGWTEIVNNLALSSRYESNSPSNSIVTIKSPSKN